MVENGRPPEGDATAVAVADRDLLAVDAAVELWVPARVKDELTVGVDSELLVLVRALLLVERAVTVEVALFVAAAVLVAVRDAAAPLLCVALDDAVNVGVAPGHRP